jgi:hypothetical protein
MISCARLIFALAGNVAQLVLWCVVLLCAAGTSAVCYLVCKWQLVMHVAAKLCADFLSWPGCFSWLKHNNRLL